MLIEGRLFHTPSRNKGIHRRRGYETFSYRSCNPRLRKNNVHSNSGPLEFAVSANVGRRRGAQPHHGTGRGITIQGGTKNLFVWPHVDRVQVSLESDGRPNMANVELWGVGNHIKAIAELYNDNGYDRPFLQRLRRQEVQMVTLVQLRIL
jgi:hypothetical protein